MLNHSEYSNTNVLITGASKGLGRALALELSARGAKVAAVARSSNALRDLKEQAPHIHIIEADVADKNSVHRIAAETNAAVGPINLLINNASELGSTPLRLLLDSDCEDLEHVLQTNLVGPFRLTKILLAPMLLRGGGTVLNISSDAAVSAYPHWGVYSASKAALDHISRVWASEIAAQQIRILALDPGDMNTEMHQRAIPDQNPDELLAPVTVAREIADFLALETTPNQVRFARSEWTKILQGGIRHAA